MAKRTIIYWRDIPSQVVVKQGRNSAKKQLSKLKIYTGEDHPHGAQNPETIDLSKLNSKNIARN